MCASKTGRIQRSPENPHTPRPSDRVPQTRLAQRWFSISAFSRRNVPSGSQTSQDGSLRRPWSCARVSRPQAGADRRSATHVGLETCKTVQLRCAPCSQSRGGGLKLGSHTPTAMYAPPAGSQTSQDGRLRQPRGSPSGPGISGNIQRYSQRPREGRQLGGREGADKIGELRLPHAGQVIAENPTRVL